MNFQIVLIFSLKSLLGELFDRQIIFIIIYQNPLNSPCWIVVCILKQQNFHPFILDLKHENGWGLCNKGFCRMQMKNSYNKKINHCIFFLLWIFFRIPSNSHFPCGITNPIFLLFDLLPLKIKLQVISFSHSIYFGFAIYIDHH